MDVYYRDPARTTRMDALNRQFVASGGLVFDIGAHVGDRAASFARLGAHVVALEPQQSMFRVLRLIHGRNPNIVLRREAVGAAAGWLTLHINANNPTVSTASTAFIMAANGADGWQDQAWDDQLRVPVTTLDQLIVEHGAPDFIKIDVEGFEAHALQGLSTPVAALSFEFTTIQRDVAYACMALLEALGDYTFNVSLGEGHALCFDAWQSAEALRTHIAGLPDAANSGDVYARLAR